MKISSISEEKENRNPFDEDREHFATTLNTIRAKVETSNKNVASSVGLRELQQMFVVREGVRLAAFIQLESATGIV